MTDNKKLIEEARMGLAAFDEYWRDGCPVDAARGRPWELIRGLLAVFEKAHTPTDDERAIAVCIEIASTIYGGYDDAQGALSDIHMMLAPIAAGFRHSEAPEPSAEDTRPGFFPNGQCRHYQLADGWAKIWCIRTESGHTEHETAGGVRWTPDALPEPQGEPSDAQGWSCGKCDREEALGRDDGQIPTHHRSCQADVKLLAAANAYMRYQPPYDDLSAFSPQFRADMRAALRAAGGAR